MHWTTTKSGRFYSISRYKGRLVATKACEFEDCAALEMTELPKGADWSFGEARPRKRHSVTMVATFGGSQHHLLHYESGGWKLNPMPGKVTGLWATKDGGLWVQLSSSLLTLLLTCSFKFMTFYNSIPQAKYSDSSCGVFTCE